MSDDKWTLDDPDDNGGRALTNGGKGRQLHPDDQKDAAAAPTRVDFEKKLREHMPKDAPPFSDDDLDRLRRDLGGEPFKKPPTIKRVP